MSAGRLVPVVLLLAAAAGVAFLLLEQPDAGGLGQGLDREGTDGTAGGDLAGRSGAQLTGSSTGLKPASPGGAEAGSDEPPPPTFPAEEGVAGRVVDARQRPIAGATVTLHPSPLENQWYGTLDPDAVAETKTRKDGTFLVGPAPAGRLKVRAVASGYAPSVQQVPRRGSRIELVLDIGGGLAVTVVDGKGQALAEVAVYHFSGQGGWQPPVVSAATTGADGVASFLAVPTGSGSVLATRQGLGAVRQQDVGVAPGGKTELTLVLQAGRALTGTVTNAEDQRPVSGATLEVQYPFVPGLKPSAPVTTGDDGRYRLPIDVGPFEQFELRARHPDFAEVRQWLNFNDSGTGSMNQDVKLGKGAGGYAGRVLSREGGGAAGVTVTYGQGMPGQKAPSTTTDGEGRFDLPAPVWASPGSSWVLIASSSTEGVGSVHAALPQKNESRGKPLEIRLSGTGSVEGTVKDGGGQPAQGAAITLTMDWNAMQAQARTGGRGFDWMAWQALQDPNVASRLTAVSDAEGRFTVLGVPTAMYRLEALWGGLQATFPEALDVRAGSPARADLVLGEGLTISGMVLDGEDRPVPGAQVYGQPGEQRPGATPTWPNGRSQSDGAFTLRNVGTGTYALTAQAAGYTSETVRNVTPGTRDVTLRLKALGWVEGQVTTDGEPLAGAFTVTATRKAERNPSGRAKEMVEDGGGRSQLFSSPDGRFVLRGLSSGDWHVSASTPDGLVVLEAMSVSVTDGRGSGPVRLTLQQGARIIAEVEGADGRPLVGAWVWAQTARGEDGRQGPGGGGRTDDKGTVLLRGLGAGPYRVSVNTDQGVQWSEALDLTAGEEKRLRMREQLPGRVRVTVVDAGGNPLAKANPSLTDASGNQIWPNWQLLRRDGLIDTRGPDAWERATTTDASGTLMRHHVPPGRYRVSAVLAGYTPPADAPWVEVGSGAVTDVTVTLTAVGG